MGARVARTAAVAAVCLSLGGCWLAPGQGPDRRAHNPFESGLTAANVATLEQAWSTDTGDGRVNAPVVSGGGVHVSAGLEVVTLDPATGAERWTYTAPTIEGPGTTSEVFVRDDEVLLGYGYGNLGGNWHAVALDTADGTARELPFGGLLDSVRDATVARRTFSFGSGTPVVQSLGLANVETGEGWFGVATVSDSGQGAMPPVTVATSGLWQAGQGLMNTTPVAEPHFGNAVRFYTTARPPNCAPGTFPQYIPCPQSVAPIDGAATSPVIGPSLVYVGTNAGTMYAVDQADGSVAWYTEVPGPVTAPPAATDDRLFGVTTSGDLVVLDAATGEALWGAGGLGTLAVQPAVAGGVVYVAGNDGVVRAFDAAGCGAASCSPLWQADTGDSAITGDPAVSNGRLLVGTQDGRVVAFAPGG